jgi:hypothetical protein
VKPSLKLKSFVASLEVSNPDELQWPALRSVFGTLAAPMLSHSTIWIVGMAGVIAPIGASQDVDVEGHSLTVPHR